MDPQKYKYRIQRRLYHHGCSEKAVSTTSLPLTEVSMDYFQDSFDGAEGLGRLDMPMTTAITKKNKVSPCSVVLSMLYAKRLRQRNRQYLQSMSSTDVFFISMMMASKYLYDEGVDEEVYNDEWADSIGQEVEDVNQMEMDFLREMDWQLFVKPDEFDSALTAVERRLALKEGMKRGWFTYTEMEVLLDWDPIYQMWSQFTNDCTKVVSVLSAVYVAGLLSMMGSAAIALQLSVPMATATVSILSLHQSLHFGNIFPVTYNALLQPPHHTADDVNSSSVLPLLLSDLVDVNGFELNGMEDNKGDAVVLVDNSSQTSEELLSLDIDSSPLQSENGNFHSQSDMRETTELDEKGEDHHYNNGKGVSVLSLLFFDSLLSQICSVYSGKKCRKVCADKDDEDQVVMNVLSEEQSVDNHFLNCISSRKVCQCPKSTNQRTWKRKNSQLQKQLSQYKKQFTGQSLAKRSSNSDNGANFQYKDEKIVEHEELTQSERETGNVSSKRNRTAFNPAFSPLPASSHQQTSTFNLPFSTKPYPNPTLKLCLSESYSDISMKTCLDCNRLNPRQQCERKGHTMQIGNFQDVAGNGVVPLKPTMALPESLTADVPILEPVRFITKNSSHPVVLAT